MIRSTFFPLVMTCLLAPHSVLWAQGFSPEVSAARMHVPAGWEARPVAAEPLVRQPVAIEFDDRGRLWVIQYLQYPNPEGLQRVTVDRYSRTRYDRVPEPPPRGPRGADRITILEDTDGDGRMDRGQDFVNGLNLATGLAFGHGGLFVLNVPYLLFYPDRNRDDQPDTDPEVLLTGFGMEDAHSVANSLTWGPDGWLYGCQGSTVTANIRGIEFQQGVWRYHPLTREFELFCEGGGNSWGLDFDAAGRLLYSTNYGGHTLLHGVQGGYFVKSFGKHGALHNPHAYGYFEHAPHRNFRGGHVTVGGIVYQEEAFPPAFRGKYIAGDLLGHGVYWHQIEPRGSTVATAHGGELLVANDSWFAPTDVTVGPDGAVYVADWYDARTAHPDPDADWDRSNGRIWRLAPRPPASAPPAPDSSPPRPAAPTPKIDLAKSTTESLQKLLNHPAQWYARRARQELVRRHITLGEPIAAASLEAWKSQATTAVAESEALAALWTLTSLQQFDEMLAMACLQSPHAAVRSWTVRLLGDTRKVSPEMAHRLDEMAEQEPAVEVRLQLACTAQRLPAAQALPIINANINRDIDNEDPYLPLLWWWAVEKQSITGREEVLKRFVRPTLWKSQLGSRFLLPRLVRRYAAEGTTAGLDSLERLLAAAPSAPARTVLWNSVWQGWQERAREAMRELTDTDLQMHPVSQRLLQDWQSTPDDLLLLQLAIAWGHRQAADRARQAAFQPDLPAPRRVALLTMLSAAADPTLIEPTLELLDSNAPESVHLAALDLLSRFDDPRLPARLIAWHQSSSSPSFKSRVRDLLLARSSSARAWLQAVDQGKVSAAETPLEQIRRVTLLQQPELNALVIKHWGRVEAATREEKLAEVRRLNNDLRAAGGNVGQGRELFKKHCANCHQLFGEGAKVGPELTSANRQDRDFLLVSLVDPSSVIRKEYVSVVIQTTDGRVITGLPVARTDAQITLLNAKNEQLVVPMSAIEELHDSDVSFMPADLYRQLKPQELRDLFAYLQSAGPGTK